MSVPVGYPPLESACNVHLPLHFTRNVNITQIEYPRDRIRRIAGDTIQNLRDELGEVKVPIRNWAVPDNWGIDA